MTEVLVAVIGGGFGLLTLFMQQHLSKTRRDMAEVKEQVQNSHGTNLRDDLDFIRDVILDVRADMSWLRRDHLDLTKRVDLIEGAA